MLHIRGLRTFIVNHKQAKLQCNIFTVCFQVKHCPVTSVTQTSHGVTVIAKAINVLVILHMVKMRALKFTGWKKMVKRRSTAIIKTACHRDIVVERSARSMAKFAGSIAVIQTLVMVRCF